MVKQKINKKKVLGYVMAITGFIIILINAIGYVFRLNITSPVLVIMGLVFVAVGMKTVRESSK